MDMLLSVPDEILLMIFGHLRRVNGGFYSCRKASDILSCRLVCKRLANIGQEVAFKHIKLKQDEKGFKRLLELSRSPLCKAVQKLSCYFEVFEAEPATSLSAFKARLGGVHEHLSPLRVKEKFEEYRRGRQYQNLLERDSRHLASLADALSQFQNLRIVYIKQSWEEALEDGDGLGYHTISSTPSVGHRFFEAIADALATSENGIEGLMLGNFHSKWCTIEDHGLVSIIQGLAPAPCQKYQWAFGKLKRLKIELPWILDGGERLNFPGLSALIRSATLLEELNLSFTFASIPPLPPYFLRSVEILNLRTLVLTSATLEEPGSLLAFLRNHSATLRNVRFFGLCLEDGSWETAFIGMRDIMTLQSSSMKRFLMMYNGIEEKICPWEDDRAAQFDQAIGDFIQRKTDTNPFDLLRTPPK